MDTRYPSRRLSSTFVISMLTGATLVAAGFSIGHEHHQGARAMSEASTVASASAPQMVTLERVVVVRHRNDVSATIGSN
jgi:hypothetical protein